LTRHTLLLSQKRASPQTPLNSGVRRIVIQLLALAVIVLAGVYLIGLAAASILAPIQTARFLNGFAGSARAHYSEIGIRLAVGIALVLAAPRMLYSSVFQLFGWVVVATSIVLLLIPWRWHQRFAQLVVPPLTKRVWLFALLSLPLGGVILFAVLYRGAA
jgi:hypothetical protein